MKKLRSLLIILMAVLVLTGCGAKSSDSSSSKKEDKKKTEEKVNKDKDNKKDDDKKDDNKKDDNKKDDNKKNDKPVNADKTLTCSINEEGQDMKITIGWKNEEINTIGVDVKMDVSDYGVDEETFDLVASYLDEAMKESFGVDENTQGIEFKSTIDKEAKLIKIVMNIDLTKVSPEVVEQLNLDFTEDDLKSSYEDIKAAAEQDGYTCE